MLSDQIQAVRKRRAWEHRGSEPGDLLQPPARPCRIRVAFYGKDNRKVTVRCECMSEVWGRPSPRYFNYDPLGIVDSLSEAVELWRDHLRPQQGG